MVLEPNERISLVDSVVARLQSSIESGSYRSGDRLPSEMELVSQLGVSRTVLREAIKRLQTNGLVTIRRGIGTYVAERDDFAQYLRLVRTAMVLSCEELIPFVELREAIEVHAAGRAAILATKEDVEALSSLCEQMEDEGQHPETAMKLDLQFHLKIVEISKNSLMRSVLEIIQEFILEGMQRTTPEPRQWPMSKRSHMAIVDAISNRDADAAGAAIRDHMNILVRRLQESD